MREIMNARIVILISEAMDDKRMEGTETFVFFLSCCAGICVSFLYICNQRDLIRLYIWKFYIFFFNILDSNPRYNVITNDI